MRTWMDVRRTRLAVAMLLSIALHGLTVHLASRASFQGVMASVVSTLSPSPPLQVTLQQGQTPQGVVQATVAEAALPAAEPLKKKQPESLAVLT